MNVQPEISKQMIAQLNDVLAKLPTIEQSIKDHNVNSVESGAFVTRALAAISRVGGTSSVYSRQAARSATLDASPHLRARPVAGVVKALLEDVEKGYLQSQQELIHGELFGDFLEMAQHLLDEGYKDAAAVIAGSSLEAHLRQLCVKVGIDTEVTRPSDGKIMPKKADQMNSDLAKASVCSKGDQKNVTAWLDLRNDAAHGHYEKYQDGQVGLLIAGVRDFISRNPA